MTRYLTPEAKARALAEWADYRAQPIPDRPDLGGLGYQDPEIVPLCERLNALPGVCTLQSCAGHEYNSHGPSSTALVWVWLDRATARRFEMAATVIAAQLGSRMISKFWFDDGREVVEIRFPRHGIVGFEKGCATVAGFLEALSRPVAVAA